MRESPLHPWDVVRAQPTTLETIPAGARGVHESVLRSFQILRQVKTMLARGDSNDTIQDFIEWVESRP